MKNLGPSFPHDLAAAGLTGLPFSWGDDGVVQYDPRMAPEQIAAVEAVIAAHDPTKPAPPTEREVDRATLIAKIDAALADAFVPAKLKDVLGALKKVV